MLTEDLKEIAESSLFFSSYKRSKLYDHLNTYITSRTIRSSLRETGLIAFIADGSVLPRRSDGLAPMIGAIPFTSPDALRVSFVTADGRTVEGMGIPEGLTAVVGPPLSGKSTILDAIASGVHDHIPGDGRELVITVGDASVVSSDTGRTARNADVSLLISDASYDTGSFSTDDADDITSSALSVTEALEIGCRLLVIKDMSVNHGLLYNDKELSGLSADRTSVVPITDAIKGTDISAVIECRHHQVADASDTVLVMHSHTVASVARRERTRTRTPKTAVRMPIARNMDVSKGRKETNSAALSASKAEIGATMIKLPYTSDICRTAAVADAVVSSKEMMDGTLTMNELVVRIEKEYRERINSVAVNIGPERIAFRAGDLANVINRHPDIVFAYKR
jgi:predicted ABC-class ATPase